MSAKSTTQKASKRHSGGIRRALVNASKTARGRVGLALTLVVALLAFGGPFVPGEDPEAFVGMPFTPPALGGGPLGTDVLGRSVLARLLDGGYQLLVLAIVATALALAIGTVIGIVAAYREGWADLLLMRSVDILLVIPQLVFVLLLVSVNGTSSLLVVVAVAAAQAPQVARVVYAAAQGVCERDFVKAVALWGVPPRKVIFGQVLPNLVTPLSVEFGLRLSFSIILIAGLNFLGFGVTPPDPSWGVMVNENRIGLAANPWGVLAPAIVLGVLAVGTNMFADAIARANFGEDKAEVIELASELPQEQSA